MKTYDVDLWVHEESRGHQKHLNITRIEVFTTPLAPSGDKPLRYETFVKAYHEPITHRYPLSNVKPKNMSFEIFMGLEVELVKALAEEYEEERGTFCYSDAVTTEVSRFLMQEDEALYSALPELSWCESGMSSLEHYHLIFGTW